MHAKGMAIRGLVKGPSSAGKDERQRTFRMHMGSERAKASPFPETRDLG